MKKKKSVKTKTKVKKGAQNMVLYVEDCVMRCRVFKTPKEAFNFVSDFSKKYPKPENGYGDDWIEMVITNIKGKITSLDTIKVES